MHHVFNRPVLRCEDKRQDRHQCRPAANTKEAAEKPGDSAEEKVYPPPIGHPEMLTRARHEARQFPEL